jgi:biopolymer transport protein ExbB
MSRFRYALIAMAAVLVVPRALVAQDTPATLEDLLNAVRADSQQRSRQNQEREQRFVQARDQQRALLQQAQRSLREEETRSDQLKASFDENERVLGELSETLQVRVGNMGELFGVVRQVAGDAKGIIDNSMISAQIANRAGLANELAQARGLPSIKDLTNLYGLLLEEMIESGKVVRFRADIFDAEGKGATADVVRVGVFNAVTEDRFLNYKPATGTLQELARQPAGRFRSLAGDLWDAESGTLPMAVDPSRGTILGLLIQAPSLVERVQQGGLVGYVIILLGLLGALVGLERLL